jgi:hypothetical protein
MKQDPVAQLSLMISPPPTDTNSAMRLATNGLPLRLAHSLVKLLSFQLNVPGLKLSREPAFISPELALKLRSLRQTPLQLFDLLTL